MITRAPSLTMCGTVFPVWLNGMFILLTLVFIYIRDDYSIDWCMYKKYNMIFLRTMPMPESGMLKSFCRIFAIRE